MIKYVVLVFLCLIVTILMFESANISHHHYKKAKKAKEGAKSIDEEEIYEFIMRLNKDYPLHFAYAFIMLVLFIILICIGPNAFIS